MTCVLQENRQREMYKYNDTGLSDGTRYVDLGLLVTLLHHLRMGWTSSACQREVSLPFDVGAQLNPWGLIRNRREFWLCCCLGR